MYNFHGSNNKHNTKIKNILNSFLHFLQTSHFQFVIHFEDASCNVESREWYAPLTPGKLKWVNNVQHTQS